MYSSGRLCEHGCVMCASVSMCEDDLKVLMHALCKATSSFTVKGACFWRAMAPLLQYLQPYVRHPAPAKGEISTHDQNLVNCSFQKPEYHPYKESGLHSLTVITHSADTTPEIGFTLEIRSQSMPYKNLTCPGHCTVLGGKQCRHQHPTPGVTTYQHDV